MQKPINCLIVDDEPMAREILITHLKKIEEINIVSTCKNAVEAFNIINEKQIDLIFLDINMPNISGLSFAASISYKIKVIFTTAYRDYAVEGFNLKAVDYLLKPISLPRLVQAINKYKEENNIKNVGKSLINNDESKDFIFIRADRKMYKINYTEILYVESYGDYLKIHTKNKLLVTRETIVNIENKLPSNKFMRIHRSYIVSINKIKSFTSEFIEINNKALPISRTYKKEVLSRLENS